MMFIQILDKSKLKESKTQKLEQFRYLKEAVSEILPLRNRNKILCGIFHMSINDFEEPMKKIIDTIDVFKKEKSIHNKRRVYTITAP